MLGKRIKTLRQGHRRALGLSEQDNTETKSPSAMPPAAERYFAKHPELKTIPPHIVRKAWFTMSHLLLPPGSLIGDMGCEEGHMTYVMAILNPQINFIGVDMDEKKIETAKEKWKLPNLRFRNANIAYSAAFDREYFDAIINSFILHEISSGSRYSDRQIVKTLEQQFSLLKQEGWMFIRDFALRRPPTEYVLLEMPDPVRDDETEEESKERRKDIAKLNEAELLVWYSEHAKPTEDAGITGFFLEELPARYPQTRLFRLPYKWAYEFIVRKDDRATLQNELHKEYTFFTEQEFNRHLRLLGTRVMYHAPHWDDSLVNKCFEGKFRLFDDEGRPLGPPPTSYIALSQKMGERKSLSLQERRPSQKPPEKLKVTAMRNEKTGRIVDIVSRDHDITEIIPYRVAPEGQLHVFVHEGLPRGIVNAVPRNSKNLDGRAWSGHMCEAITVPSHVVHSVDQGMKLNVDKFARDHLGLKPESDAELEQGQSYYPAPDYIDEVVKTRYVRVREHQGAIEPKAVMDEIQGFTTFGRIREINAQKVLDAISVGLIPNSRLELQILALFEKLKMLAETWEECPLVLEESRPEIMFNAKNHIKLKAEKDHRFRKVKGTAGQLRSVQSTFVDEGWVEGSIAGMASRDMEFIISDENTLNRAVILPLTKKDGQIMMGFEVDYLPAPQRIEGNGLTARAPSVTLPKEVTSVYQARKYVADLFGVPIDCVWRMGESYFCHAGVTPQRIFPFAVATRGQGTKILSGPVQFAPMRFIFQVFNNFMWKGDCTTLLLMTRSRRRLGAENHDMGFQLGLGFELANKPVDPGVMHVATLAGLGGPSGATAPSGVTASAGVASLMRNGMLAEQADKPAEDKDEKGGKGSLKKKYAQ